MSFNYTFRYFDTNLQITSYTVTTKNMFPANITDADPASITLVDGPIVQKDLIITGNSMFEGGTSFTGTVDMSSASVNLSLSELTDVNINTQIVTKGDIFVYSGTDWQAIPIGIDDQILTASSTATLGLSWENGNEKIGFEVYDALGGQTTAVTDAPVVLNLDTVRTSNSNISLASNEVTVNRTGIYHVNFRVSTQVSTGTSRSTSACYLETDTGSGFTKIAGSDGFMYNRQATSNLGVNTGSVSLVLDIDSGDKFRIIFYRDNGTDTIQTIGGGSGITFVGISGSGLDGQDGPQGPAGPPGPSGSGVTINVYDTGVPIANSPFETINFLNPITATFNSTVTTQVDISYAQPTVSLYSTSNATIGATETDLPFTNQHLIDIGTFTHTLNNPEVLIKKDGRYDITGIVSTDGGGRTVSAFVLKRSTNGGVSYNDIPGTNGFMYNRSTSDGENTGVARAIIDLNSNDIIKIQARRVGSGTAAITFIPEGCSLHILKLQ